MDGLVGYLGLLGIVWVGFDDNRELASRWTLRLVNLDRVHKYATAAPTLG
jgi:hypothetical protein